MSNITYNTEIEIRESGKLTQEFKRKRAIKRTKYILAFIQLATADLAHYLLTDPLKRVGKQIRHDLKLEYMDMFYHTNLKAQYQAGRRTQRILAVKRSYGL